MLRSLRESLHVHLAPDRLMLARAVWPKRWLLATVEAIDIAQSGDGAIWQTALDTLDRQLSLLAYRGPVHITLSHHFIRFADLPWQPKILSAPLRAIQAEHRFKQLFGAAHMGWRAIASDSAYGASALATAIDNNLLLAVQEMAVKHQVQFPTIEPWGTASINLFRKQLHQDHHAALVLVEPGKQIVLLFKGMVLAGVATRRDRDESVGGLGLVVKQEAAAIGLFDLGQNILVSHRDADPTAVPTIAPLISQQMVAAA